MQRHYSIDDYYAVELGSAIKHEYYSGEIFAMAGASVAHNHITANVLGALRTALRGTRCSAFGSDLRLTTPAGLFTYPDVMVICGQIDLTRDHPDTVTNPVLLVEVLSEATRDYDKGEKVTLSHSARSTGATKRVPSSTVRRFARHLSGRKIGSDNLIFLRRPQLKEAVSCPRSRSKCLTICSSPSESNPRSSRARLVS